ncbi:MAG: hypothetical protein ACWGSQ_10745 [Longimicrobiales bacterium]
MIRTPALRLLVVMAALPLAACGPGSSDLDPNAFAPAIREIKDDPSFSADIQGIFDSEGCTNGACHGVGASAGLNLERGLAYANLVGVAATQEGFERVTAEKAAESYLIIKLEGRQQVGTRMPPSGSPLDEIHMGNLKNWINKGAKNN